MGMSTSVIGFKPPDEKWKAMKKIRDACLEIGIEIPHEVEEFFDYDEPDEEGVSVDLKLEKWSDDCGEGYQLQVKDIPKDVKIIRFYNSW